MIIKTANKEINVNTIISTSFKIGTNTFPAFKILFPDEVPAENVAEILSGSFDILNDKGDLLGTHEGYTTLREIALTVGKITTDEERIMQLEDSLNTANSELASTASQLQTTTAELQNANNTISELEVENAELLFNSLTDEDFDTVVEEETTEPEATV